MRNILKIVSYIVLAVMVVLAVLVFNGNISVDLNKTLLLILTVIWFVATPFWMLSTEK